MANTGKRTQQKKKPTNQTNSKRKTTTAKRSTGGKNKKKSAEKYVPTEKDLMVRNEVKLLVLAAVSLILLLSNFGVCGTLGNYLSRIMFGVFGIYAYIVPVLLIFGGAFMISNFGNRKAMVKVGAGVVLLILLCTVLHMIVVENYDTMTMADTYDLCAKKRYGGGVAGGFVAQLLTTCIGVAGTYIVSILLAVAAFVLLTERSVVGGVKKQGQKVYHNAKEDVARFRENQEYARAERARKKRLEDKYKRKGIALGDTALKQNQERIDDGMREIHAADMQKAENPADFQGRIHIHTQSADMQPAYEEPEQKSDQSAVFVPVMEVQEVQEKEPEILQESEEPFVPKEKIVVSKAAMDTMHRGVFGMQDSKKEAALTEAESQVRVHTEGDSTDVRETPVPDTTRTVRQTEKKPEPRSVLRQYMLPPMHLLNFGSGASSGSSEAELKATAVKLQQTLQNFGVGVTITDVSRGPSVTRYELQPEQGTKVSKITSLTDDIKLNLAASDIRIEAPIPGKAAVGIEVPNASRDTVFFRELIESKELKTHPSKLAFAAGKDIAGKVIVADIAKMPHMLIAGTTGSGKSVFTNSIIMSILYRAKPSEVKLIIVDPKVVEFGVYNGIPHLLIPVVTDPKKAAGALHWAVAEMQDRYAKFAQQGVRDLKGYNAKITSQKFKEGGEQVKPLPQIVIIIDELADLMMAAAKEVEDAICRLAQLARAAGIHLVIATQRPSVDVVTGLIKANIPSRVALLVSSGTDSRTIIDMNGAEKLLGNGDMLFYPSGYVKPVRLQGAFISDEEVSRVVSFITKQSGEVTYDEEITKQIASPAQDTGSSEAAEGNGRDAYFNEAARFVIEREKASTSMLQRMFKIGFNRAARIMEQLSEANVVGNEEGTKPRKVLMTMEQFEAMLAEEDRQSE